MRVHVLIEQHSERIAELREGRAEGRFFRTRMGHPFLRSSLPRHIDELGRLANGVAKLNEALGSRPDAREGVGPRARAS